MSNVRNSKDLCWSGWWNFVEQDKSELGKSITGEHSELCEIAAIPLENVAIPFF